MKPSDQVGSQGCGPATPTAVSECMRLEDELRLRSAIARLQYGESPLAIRGALFAVLSVQTREAWTGTFEHLAGRRSRMLPLLDALDDHYQFVRDPRPLSRPLDVDAVRTVSSATAAMTVLPFAVDLLNALLAVQHERALVHRLTRGRHTPTLDEWRRPSVIRQLFARPGDHRRRTARHGAICSGNPSNVARNATGAAPVAGAPTSWLEGSGPAQQKT